MSDDQVVVLTAFNTEYQAVRQRLWRSQCAVKPCAAAQGQVFTDAAPQVVVAAHGDRAAIAVAQQRPVIVRGRVVAVLGRRTCGRSQRCAGSASSRACQCIRTSISGRRRGPADAEGAPVLFGEALRRDRSTSRCGGGWGRRHLDH